MSDKPSPRKRTNRADVMISSTTLDLPEHRKAVTDAIWRVKMYPLAMESGSAVPDSDAIRFSLNMVDESEVYMGILGFRYGYVPTDLARNPDAKSITELEYREAVKRGIPILIYIMSDKHTILDNNIETDPVKLEKLNKLRAEFKDKHLIAEFDSVEDLKSKVLQSLYEFAINGIIDNSSDETDEKQDQTVLTIPEPPKLYSVPPYILTNTFIGRVKELNQLDSWAQSTSPILVIDAIGGMGKSALTWEWVNNPDRARKAIPGLKGIFWWSFYEHGATMEAFIRHALAYINLQNPDSPNLKNLRYEERASQLLVELKRAPYLLVLDGLERILLAYHRWDAAQMRDDALDDSPSPEAKGMGMGNYDPETSFRACTDPRDADFLQRLIAAQPSKFLISSRLMPLIFEDQHNPLPGVRHTKLVGLSLDDAYQLMLDRGIKADDRATLDRFMTNFGCHSLLLKIVAGRIKNYRLGAGNFDKWYADEGSELHLAEMDIKQKRTHILEYAFQGLDEDKGKLLSQIAAFSDAVDYDTISVFDPYKLGRIKKLQKPDENPFELIFAKRKLSLAKTHKEQQELSKKLQEKEAKIAERKAAYNEMTTSFDKALTELEERGLLQWDREQDSYDLHPVVRGYSFDLLEQYDKVQVFEQIHDHFQSRPQEDLDKAVEIEDIKNTIEMYRTLLGGGKLDAAAKFFNSRLNHVLVDNIAAYHKAMELLTPLFRDGIDKPPPLTDTATQNAIIINFANLLRYIRRTDESIGPQELLLKRDLERKDAYQLIHSLVNYSLSLHDNNGLYQSLDACQLARDLAQVSTYADGLALSQLKLLVIYRSLGDWTAADEAYGAFIKQPISTSTAYWQAEANYFYAETLIARKFHATVTLDKAEKLANQSRHTMMIRAISNLRGEVALSAGRLDEAADYFQTAITLARKSGLSGSGYRGGLAKTRAAQGNVEEAYRLVEEGVNSIDAAEVFLILEDMSQTNNYAIKAYEWAWADGSPYSRWWPLERAKKILDSLDIPYPELPVFDLDKAKPIPYKNEIRDFISELEAKKGRRRK